MLHSRQPLGFALVVLPTAFVALFMIALPARAASPDLQSMQALNDGLTAAFNSGDSRRIAEKYAEDAVLMPPGAKMIKGRDGVQRYWATAARTVRDSKLTAVDLVSVSETEAIEIGPFTAKTTGAHPRAVTGKFALLWRKVDGDWKVAVDIWNANN